MVFAIFLAFSLFQVGTFGELVCEDLSIGMCSYSIASSGKRCVLETYEATDGRTELQCQTSEVMVHTMKEHIENEQCIDACGLDRLSVGISTDSLAQTKSVWSLCSADCYHNCPNIIDLFDSLALAEGASLRARCKNVQSRLTSVALAATQAPQYFGAETPIALADPPVMAPEPPVFANDPPVPGNDPSLSALTTGRF